MNIMLVDDEPLALSHLARNVIEVCPGVALQTFQWSEDALSYARKNTVDIAFLDIEMPEMDGLSLAGELKKLSASINIIFITAHPQYALDTYRLHASGYLLKPTSPASIRHELDELRRPVPSPKRKVQVRTFGSFEVFVDGLPLHFSRSKAKELFALLVDQRGASVTVRQAAAVLFEDQPYSRKLSTAVHMAIRELKRALLASGVEDILLKDFNSIAVDTDKFQCDYYDFLNGDPGAAHFYQGSYMSNYSWAEFTTAALNSFPK